MTARTVEELLRELETKAAMLQYLHECAAMGDDRASPRALSGIADVCGELADFARIARRCLPSDALGMAITSKPDRGGARDLRVG
jgi:hypothetical protein